MIKKNDLVKQFELLSKQEIINHNVQIAQSNESINELGERFSKIEERIAHLLGRENTNYHYFRSELTDISKEIRERLGSQEAKNRDHERILKDLDLNLFNSSELHKFYRSKLCDFESELKLLRESWTSIVEKLKNIENKIEDSSNSSLKRACNYADRMISLHEAKECPAQKVKSELKSQMEVDRVDFTGIMRELAVLKKESYVNEKKIENLYTLIERLKGK